MKKIELMWWVLATAWIVIGILQLVSGNLNLATIDLITGLVIAVLATEIEMKV